jgi:hypothetical protein
MARSDWPSRRSRRSTISARNQQETHVDSKTIAIL